MFIYSAVWMLGLVLAGRSALGTLVFALGGVAFMVGAWLMAGAGTPKSPPNPDDNHE
jgi:hypothetical protein